MARFYVLTIEPTLFGDTALVREWGRLGQRGRRRLDLFAGRVQAVEALEAWLLPTTAKVENIALVFVLSHSGQTCRWSRLAKPPKTSKVCRQLRQENS